MKHTLLPSVFGGALVGLTMFSASAPRAQEPVSFATDIKPIFENSCWTCHSASMQLSKLDLSTRDAALKGGEHGPAIVPGRAADSRLYRLVAGLDQPGMPLDGAALAPAQIAALKAWIDEGAHWDAPALANVRPAAAVPAASAENAPLPPGARDYWRSSCRSKRRCRWPRLVSRIPSIDFSRRHDRKKA